MKVLVVDDSYMIRSRLISMLSVNENVHVFGFTGEEEMDEIDQLEPDFVILDIKLKNRSGVDILKQIKGHIPEVKVAMLTNFYDSYYMDLCRSFGADYFFDKSMDFDRLASVIDDYSRIN